jgi:integrase/recombinase XerD
MLRFAEYLELQDYRERSSQSYYRAMRVIAEHCGKDPEAISEEELRSFFVYARRDLKWAPKTIRQFLAATKLFYRGMLGRELLSIDQIRARDRETLPTVLTSDEVARVIRAVPLWRYQVPLLLIYASGLRVRECVHLSINDLDGPGNRLFIRDGKGGKDRYTILSTPVHQALVRYWSYHKNPKWLFPAVGRGLRDSKTAAAQMGLSTEPMDPQSLRCRLLAAARACSITKKVTCHNLRHSFATHLAAAGVPLHQLQSYLGHANIETTTIYTHLTPINHVEAIGYVDALIEPILRRR